MSEMVERVANAILAEDAKLWGGPLAGRNEKAFRSYAHAAIAAIKAHPDWIRLMMEETE